MLDLKQFMDKAGVTKKKYVDEWIDKNLFPGALRENDKYSFPDSGSTFVKDYFCNTQTHNTDKSPGNMMHC